MCYTRRMKNKNVLISGAGVAGLTLAYWLKKFGFNTTLIEKHPVLRTGGYKIDIRGAALEILKKMDLHQQVLENRTAIRRAISVDEAGQQVAEMSADFSGSRIEGVDIEIMRCQLCRLLKESVGEIECLFGEVITALEETSVGINVTFEKSSPRLFDIIIGADGLHSNVRRLGFGPESLFSKEFGVYVAVFSIPNFLKLDTAEIEHFSNQRFLNLYKDKNDSHVTVSLAFSSPEPFDLRSSQAQKQQICKVFADFGWEMQKILAAMNESQDFYFDSTAQIHMPAWSKGRIALVGDAAYSPTPMSGQGTSIAIIGAYVLAGELAEAKGDFKKAFQNYESQLRPFIKLNQDLAKTSAAIMSGSFYSKIVFKLLALMPKFCIHYFKNQTLQRISKAANAITLKEYHETYGYTIIC